MNRTKSRRNFSTKWILEFFTIFQMFTIPIQTLLKQGRYRLNEPVAFYGYFSNSAVPVSRLNVSHLPQAVRPSTLICKSHLGWKGATPIFSKISNCSVCLQTLHDDRSRGAVSITVWISLKHSIALKLWPSEISGKVPRPFHQNFGEP